MWGEAIMTLRAVFGVLITTGLLALGANARAQTAAMTTEGVTKPPIGWVQFCRDNSADCRKRFSSARPAPLTRTRWNELVTLNVKVNATIQQVSDLDHYGEEEFWAYPDDGKGDCEDIVLEKKRRLVALGWPEETLLITVVRDENDEGHAVLSVVSEAGDFILDNRTDLVRPWSQTGYRFIKRQAQHDPNQWVKLESPARDPLTVARAGNGAIRR